MSTRRTLVVTFSALGFVLAVIGTHYAAKHCDGGVLLGVIALAMLLGAVALPVVLVAAWRPNPIWLRFLLLVAAPVVGLVAWTISSATGDVAGMCGGY
jgi:hypothetical protein